MSWLFFFFLLPVWQPVWLFVYSFNFCWMYLIPFHNKASLGRPRHSSSVFHLHGETAESLPGVTFTITDVLTEATDQRFGSVMSRDVHILPAENGETLKTILNRQTLRSLSWSGETVNGSSWEYSSSKHRLSSSWTNINLYTNTRYTVFCRTEESLRLRISWSLWAVKRCNFLRLTLITGSGGVYCLTAAGTPPQRSSDGLSESSWTRSGWCRMRTVTEHNTKSSVDETQLYCALLQSVLSLKGKRIGVDFDKFFHNSLRTGYKWKDRAS